MFYKYLKFIFFFGLLLFVKPVLASDSVGEQQLYNGTPVQAVIQIQEFVPINANISKIEVQSQDFSGVNVQVHICQGTATSTESYDCRGNITIASTTKVFNSGTNTITFDPVLNINTSVKHFMSFSSYGVNQLVLKTSGGGDRYPAGNYYNSLFSLPTYDLYFKTYYSDSYVSMVTPIAGIVYKDFSNWQVNYSYSTTSTTTLKVDYGLNSATSTFSDSEVVYATGYQTNWALQKNTALGNGHWYVMASLLVGTSTVATSSWVQFDVDNINGTSNFLGGFIFTATTTTITNICQDIDTSTFFGSIDCGLRRTFAWGIGILQGSATTVLNGSIGTATTTLGVLFPFNLATNFYSSWTASASTTLPSDLNFLSIADGSGNIYIDISGVAQTGTTTNMLLFGPGLFDNSSLATFLGHIRTLSTYLLYAGFILGLYYIGRELIHKYQQ